MTSSSTPTLLPFGPLPTADTTATGQTALAGPRAEAALLAGFGPAPEGLLFAGLMPFLRPVSADAKAVADAMLAPAVATPLTEENAETPVATPEGGATFARRVKAMDYPQLPVLPGDIFQGEPPIRPTGQVDPSTAPSTEEEVAPAEDEPAPMADLSQRPAPTFAVVTATPTAINATPLPLAPGMTPVAEGEAPEASVQNPIAGSGEKRAPRVIAAQAQTQAQANLQPQRPAQPQSQRQAYQATGTEGGVRPASIANTSNTSATPASVVADSDQATIVQSLPVARVLSASPAKSPAPSVRTVDAGFVPMAPRATIPAIVGAVESSPPVPASPENVSPRVVDSAASVEAVPKQDARPVQGEPKSMATPPRGAAAPIEPKVASPLTVPAGESATADFKAASTPLAASVPAAPQVAPALAVAMPRSPAEPAMLPSSAAQAAPASSTATVTAAAVPATTAPDADAGTDVANHRTADVAGLEDDRPAVALPQQGEGWKKILLNAYKQRVTSDTETVGIKDAKHDATMPTLLTTPFTPVPTAAPVAATSVVISSLPAEWAEKLAQLTARAERLAPARLEVSLPMQGAEDLRVRVSCRGGHVSCEFQNASPELQRLFLRDWPGLAQLFGRESQLRVEQPTFVNLTDPQDRSGGDSSHRRERERRAAREEDETIADFFATQRLKK